MFPNNRFRLLAAGVILALLSGCNEPDSGPVAGTEDVPASIERGTAAQEDASEGVAPVPAAVVVAPMPPPPTEEDTTEIPVDLIIVAPAPHLGQPVVGTAKVTEVPYDRGFWIEKNGKRMFALIAQAPDMEQAVNIDPGQTIRLAGVVYDSALASGISGELDAGTVKTIAEQPAFLLVDAHNITVLDNPAK